MKSTISILFMLLTFSSNASVNSKEFVECFVKASNEIIQEIQKSDIKSEKKRMCDHLSQETIDNYLSMFSEIQNGRLVYYSKESMGAEKIGKLYDYMKDEMDCYKAKGNTASLFGAIANSPTYHRNLDLVESAINRMIGFEMWDSFFNPNAYIQLKDIDFSYCSKE
ncbi:hypothetical protein [Halobacteriovorax sp. HLS]|uniref:hypothetical protein n=1 Tax=Halobacteriovorax sp. HLS TaxID=2234000 RepID=UPI000FD72150|nr:hypothetical protein [Halobacteriovorax sp. HLS]